MSYSERLVFHYFFIYFVGIIELRTLEASKEHEGWSLEHRPVVKRTWRHNLSRCNSPMDHVWNTVCVTPTRVVFFFSIIYLSDMTRGEARPKMEPSLKTYWSFCKNHGHAKNTWSKHMAMLKTHGLELGTWAVTKKEEITIFHHRRFWEQLLAILGDF